MLTSSTIWPDDPEGSGARCHDSVVPTVAMPRDHWSPVHAMSLGCGTNDLTALATRGRRSRYGVPRTDYGISAVAHEPPSHVQLHPGPSGPMKRFI